MTLMLLVEKPGLDVVNIFVADNAELEILDEKIIFRNGAYKRVKRWYRGKHPGLGTIIKGLSGWETVVEQDVIIPMQKVVCDD
jgi:hypothetical protein